MTDQLTDIRFNRFGLPEVLLQAVDAAGFQFCTPIQAQALPVALGGGDVAGQAQTGTGKTAAFLLAMYNHLFKHDPRGDAHRGAADSRTQPTTIHDIRPSMDSAGGHDSMDRGGRAVSGTTVEEPEAAGPVLLSPDTSPRGPSTLPRGPGLVHPCTSPRAVIVAPTRELAVQIHKDAEQLGGCTGYRLGLVFGGTGYDSQRRQIESGVDVLIGTPGRMIDYYKQRIFDLKSVQVLILDEADRMFDLGFIKDIRFLLRRMPPPDERLNMLFSATLSYRVTELAYEHMNNPQFIRIEPDKRTVDTVEQLLYHVAIDEKRALLIGLLRRMDPTRTLVFVNTKDMAESLVAQIQGNGLSAEVLSGDVPQKMRLRLLQDFIEGRLPILVATDVMARGLHIPDVSHVFNFDLPQNAEDYVHRIGRTARAGKSGDAISFACERYVFSLMEIEAYLGHKIPVASVTPELLAELAPPAPRARREERGSRRRERPGNRREAGKAARHQRATPPPAKNPSQTRRAETSVAAPREKSETVAPSKQRKPDSDKRTRGSIKSGAQVSSGQSKRTQKSGTATRPRRSGSNKPVIG